MKIPGKFVFALVAACIALPALPAAAQTYTILNFFSSSPTNGEDPIDALVTDGSNLYGTAYYGGASNCGCVFALSTNGTGYTNILNFNGNSPTENGLSPWGELAIANGMLYGTCMAGGSNNYGEVFSVSTTGQNFFQMHGFIATDGRDPQSGLVLSGGVLYGSTLQGGTNGTGTLFSINPNGSGFQVVYNFSKIVSSTNFEGENPTGSLLVANNVIYGTASFGGTNGYGSVFAYHLATEQMASLHSFTGPASSQTNVDGFYPICGLGISGNTLYGAASKGGAGANGTIFSVGINGGNFTVIHNFSSGIDITPDGASPQTAPIVVGDTLYGGATSYGPYDGGTLFKIDIPSGVFTVMHAFQGRPYNDASEPEGLLLAGNILYGTTYTGGPDNDGAVFSFAAPSPIPLLIAKKGSNVILSWTNAVFNLQEAALVGGPYLTISNTSPYTNPITAPQQFFQLKY